MDVLSKVITHGFYPGAEYQLHFDMLVKTYVDCITVSVGRDLGRGRDAWQWRPEFCMHARKDSCLADVIEASDDMHIIHQSVHHTPSMMHRMTLTALM
jgi:hypothetical protein